MKKILGIFCILVFLFTSCDIIEGPRLEPNNEEKTEVEFPDLNKDSVIRKVLFEEFTGHYCTNCPEKGHRVLQDLIAKYGKLLVPVTIHAGGLAAPREEPYTYDFRTEAGDQLYNDFGVNSVPCAMVNRVKKGTSWISFYRDWEGQINAVDKNQIVAGIQIINQYDETSRTMVAHTKTTMFTEYENPIMLCVVMIEDGIVSPQLDNNVTIPDYVHHHALRASLNGTYGAYLNESGIVEKDSAYTKSYKLDFNKLKQDINYQNCTIVTYIYDAVTKEILQAESRKVSE